MATSSFQATTFDYLRVVFHRMRWIVILIFLSVSLAWVYVTFLLPKSYMSDMTVMVWSKDRDNQLVRRMISQTPLEALIDSIRSKLRVDRRLRNLACNLRFAVKEDYYARVLNQPGGLMAVDEKGLDELFAGLLRQYAAGKKI
jgi:hypothetical protein